MDRCHANGNGLSRGNSFACGATLWSWKGGYQAVPPVTSYTLAEGEPCFWG
jgi:hypothetical protein